MKNIEVELRALINDTKQLEALLLQKNARFLQTSYLRDIYFCDKNTTSFEQIEMNEVGSYSLRLRVSKNDNKEEITLNTKTITKQGDHHAWEEHEVVVNNFSEAAQILLKTEFKPFFELEKHRHAYQFGEVEIFVEEITDFGGAVELEIMCEPGKEEMSKQKIRSLLINELGLNESSILPKSTTNLIMKERAFKQEIIF